MTQQKFVSCKRNQDQKRKAWHDHCVREKIPYIVVSRRTKYADVSFDYITFPQEYDDHLKKNSKLIIEKAKQIFNKYAGKQPTRLGTERLIFFDNLPIEHSEQAANELFDLVKSAIPD